MNLQSQALQHLKNWPERTFWVGLACAALLHIGLIFEISRASPHRMGERNGAPEGLTVELVDASQLRSKSTLPLEPAGAPVNPAPATPPKPETSRRPETPPPQPETEPASQPASSPPSEQKKTAEWTIEKDALQKVPPPSTADKSSEPVPKAKEPAHPQQKRAVSSLHLDLPPDIIAPPGRSTAATRPPDITRSGENDEFGRGVIRALRQTMPGPRGQTGRVTVKLILSDKGNLSEVQLLRPATDPALTQSIVFAVKQSNFPIPPVGATLSDRTFLVTYIYN